MDGRSTDGTIAAARAARPGRPSRHETTPGKGAALRAGFAAAPRRRHRDARRRRQHATPASCPRYLGRIDEGSTSSKGSRFMRRRRHRRHQLHARRRQPGAPRPRATTASAAASPSSATATWRSAATRCRTCGSPPTASRSRPQIVVRAVRARLQHRRGPELRVRARATASPTSARSATGAACSVELLRVEPVGPTADVPHRSALARHARPAGRTGTATHRARRGADPRRDASRSSSAPTRRAAGRRSSTPSPRSRAPDRAAARDHPRRRPQPRAARRRAARRGCPTCAVAANAGAPRASRARATPASRSRRGDDRRVPRRRRRRGEPDWLERLLAAYDDPGRARRRRRRRARTGRRAGRAASRPSSTGWSAARTAGCPSAPRPVRNLIGANMSLRRDVLRRVGGFRTGVGRVGRLPSGCEETELCIRAAQRIPGGRFVYEPRAACRPRGARRAARRWRYFALALLRRGRLEGARGRSGAGPRTRWRPSAPTRPATLPRGLLRDGRAAVRGDGAALVRMAAIAAGLVDHDKRLRDRDHASRAAAGG